MEKIPFQALLLASGETQKLRPLTERIPSPMVSVLNRPIMAYNLELLGRLGIKRILVSVHAFAGSIEKYFGDGQKWGLSLEYILQRDALGSAGVLYRARRLLQENFIVMPADGIADLEIAQAIRQHVEQRALATVIVQPGSSQGSRALQVDAGGRIRANGRVKTSLPAWTDTGIYLFDPCIVDRVPPRLPFEIHQHLLPKLLAEGIPVQACPLCGYWNPLDTLQDYAAAQEVFFSKALDCEGRSEGELVYRYSSFESHQIAPGVWAGRGIKIHPDTRITPPVSIGHNSWIGRDVELGPGAIIGSNVVIDRGATVRNSIVLDCTYVGKLVNLENRLVNQDQLIDPYTDDSVRVTDPILLGKADPVSVTSGFKRPLSSFLAALLLLISLPLTLALAFLLLLTTGRAFKRVPCWSARPGRRGSPPGQRSTFDLLHFNTRREDGRPSRFGRWVDRWEGQRLPELWNVLKGDLAMVGLKPVLSEAECQIRADWQLEQDEAPAGLSGLWYIQADDDSTLEDGLIADAYYLATRSWAQDWKIFRRTPAAWYQRARGKAK
jgi:NDP-sugar pyrophosphorylase family protein/lipopolysaccharide/colanic/teichoic acid biosynthesis glycosyltransferase